jgi:hypothetical protein
MTMQLNCQTKIIILFENHRGLSHENLVCLLDFIPSVGAMVLECYDGGSLDSFLKKQSQPINARVRYQLAIGICK